MIWEAVCSRNSGTYRMELLEVIICLIAIAMPSGAPRALAQTAEAFNVFNIQNYGVSEKNVIQWDPFREMQLDAHLNF